MARFRGIAAFVLNGKRYKAGQAYADSAGVAQAGDVVYPFTSSNYSPMLAPLDAGAIAIKAGSVHATANIPCFATGANSIEG